MSSCRPLSYSPWNPSSILVQPTKIRLPIKHANQHIPQFSGYVKLAAATGEERYLSAVQNFFGMVVPGRMYAHGGTGEGELWGPPDTVAGDIGNRNCESCAAYNMLK